MRTVYVNGKFTAQQTTGVQRVASRLLQALRLPAGARWVLLCPAKASLPSFPHMEVRPVGPAGLPLHVWEQWVLPRAARGGLLLNLAGSAPAFARRQVCMLHDAAVFEHPEAYTPQFVRWYRWLFGRLARSDAGLLTVSAFSQGQLAHRLGVDRARIRIVPNGCDHLDAVVPDLSVLARHGLQACRYLLAVATDNPTKNLPALVSAYGLLPPDGARRLVIVGGSNRRVFAAGAGADDPPGLVRTGPLGDAALKALYQHATALVFPSLYEGFGLPPLEAMACGCPVIAARAAALPETCGSAALYVDPTSVDDMAETMARVLADGALRERLVVLGRQRAGAFRWSAAAARLLAALPPEAAP